MSAFPATRSNQAAQVIKFLQKHMLANHLHQYPRITKPDLYLAKAVVEGKKMSWRYTGAHKCRLILSL